MSSLRQKNLVHGHRWRVLLVCLVVVFAGQSLTADDAEWVTVEGQLRDRQGERPLARMAVVVRSSEGAVKEAISVTDVQGRFEFQCSKAALEKQDSAGVTTCQVLPTNDPEWTLAWLDPSKPRPHVELVRLAGTIESAGWRFKDGRRWLYVEADPPGEVETTVRDPSGRPLTDTEVLVVLKQSVMEWNDADRVRWRGKTDARGQIRLRCSATRPALHLLAPGMGCAFTAPTPIVADQVTRFELPPLVPFARIAGTVMTEFAPGDEIETGRFGWDDRRSRIQPDGRFELTDVVPGFCHLRLRRSAAPDRASELVKLMDVTVAPTQDVTDLKLGAAERFPKPDSLPPVRRPAAPPPDLQRNPGFRANATVYVTGRVTDVNGQPLPKSRVVVSNQYHGGLRMYETTVETLTDADGTYRADGIRLGVGGVMVAVFAPGRPVAYARGVAVGVPGTGRGVVIGLGGIETVPALESSTDDGKTEPHIRANVIVPERGGSIVVRVLEQQKPVQGGVVRLQLSDWFQRSGFGWARPEVQGQRDLRDSTWTFTQAIDDQGIARFDGLPSGEFTAIAVASKDREFAEHLRNRPSDQMAARLHRGLIAVAGKVRQHTLQLGPRHAAVPIRVLDAAEQPIGSQHIGIQFQSLGGTASWNTGRQLNPDGELKFEFDTPGLWRMVFEGQRGGVRQIPVSAPHFSGAFVVGASALLSPQTTREIQLGPMSRTVGSTLRVLDRDGQPARAFVRISHHDPDGIPRAMGSTDARGEFHFTDFDTTNNHAVVVCFAKYRVLPPLSVTLSDEQLLASRGPQIFRSFFRNGSEVEVREQPQGFVRGRATFPAGLRPEDYRLEVLAENVSRDFDPTTGEFLVGPLSMSEALLAWRHRGTAPNIDAENALLVTNVVVESNAVTRQEVRLQSVLPSQLHAWRRADWKPVAGKVRLSDGITPAANARFVTLARNARQPVSAGWSDPLGRFTTEALRVPGQVGDNTRRSGLPGPVLVAWIPGLTARAIVPLTFEGERPQELNVVLPRGHRVRGRVTVAGASALQVAAPITIVLHREGTDAFAALLNAETTADADGSLEFVGITPGRYSCQAALDDLWLSPTIELDVTADRANVSLDIPALGGTTRLRFVEPNGSPWQRHLVEVDWPTGPLTSRLRPASFTTDAGGNFYLDGASAGTLRVRLQGHADWQSVTIPKLGHSTTEPQTLTVMP